MKNFHRILDCYALFEYFKNSAKSTAHTMEQIIEIWVKQNSHCYHVAADGIWCECCFKNIYFISLNILVLLWEKFKPKINLHSFSCWYKNQDVSVNHPVHQSSKFDVPTWKNWKLSFSPFTKVVCDTEKFCLHQSEFNLHKSLNKYHTSAINSYK